MLADKVWDDLECSNSVVEDRAIEFGDDLCATLVL